MARIWTYIRTTILVWGFFSLAIVLFVVISLTISTITSDKPVIEDQEILQKAVNDVTLRVTQKLNENNEVLINITKGERRLVTDYKLPTEKFGLGWIKVTDVSFSHVKGDEYRVIVFSAIYDCDRTSGQHVWFLKFKEKINFVTMISLSDLHKVEGDRHLLWGNKSFVLPAFGKTKYEHITVPVEVRIGGTITTAPMLNQKSIDMLKGSFGKDIEKRISMLKNSPDTALHERYKKLRNEFRSALSESTVQF